jgi:HAD superfamily hydrolase (TIGR01509 family)
MQDGVAVSATAVREAVVTGNMPRAAALLGRPFTVCLPVSHGNHLGHTLGFPTVNQVFPADAVVPRFGVYASLVVIGNKQYPAVTNVGVHPTVSGCASPQAETWISEYEGDLYGTVLSVELIEFLRPEQRFDGIDSLKSQIERDKIAALGWLRGEDGRRAVLFDFDDTIANRPQAFLACMAEMISAHCPDLTPEEIAARARRMLEENRGGYVNYPAYFERFFNLWQWEDVAASSELFEEYLRCFGNHVRLLPETEAVLTELHRRGYRLGLVTNGSGLLQNGKLDTAGIRPLLDTVTVCGDEGVQKPDPEPFLRTAARLGVAPKHCVFVGDYEPTDLRGAEAAGMKPVCIDLYGGGTCPPHIPLIRSLPELLELLS